MKQEYIITNEEMSVKGLDLNDYALDGTYIDAIINRGLDIAVSRICFLNDNIETEEDIESFLDNNQNKVKVFKKLVFTILWNMIFAGETSPTDIFVDTIIVHELNMGKINGIQKGLYWSNR